MPKNTQQEAKIITPKRISREEVESIFNTSKGVEALLHVCEESWLEFHVNYETTAPSPTGEKAKLDLAIDISSLKNSGGGFLVAGVATEKSETELTDYVTDIKGIKEASYNLESWDKSLREYTAPSLSLSTAPKSYTLVNLPESRSIIIIKVEGVEPGDGYPVIVTKDKLLNDQGKKIKGSIFGLYRRDGPTNIIESGETLQRLLSGASSVRPEEERLARLEERTNYMIKLLEDRHSPPEQDHSKPNDTDEDSLTLLQSKLSSEKGIFYIHAVPTRVVNVENFTETLPNPTTIPYHLKYPPSFRRHGWDLAVADHEQPTLRFNKWEIHNGQRKYLSVSKDSTVVAGVSIAHFLDWKMEHEQNFGITVNEYALAEYLYSFVKFIEVLNSRNGASNWDISYGFMIDDGISVGLAEPDGLVGIPSNPPAGPLGAKRSWKQTNQLLKDPELIAGQMLDSILKEGFNGEYESEYLINKGGVLKFDKGSYKNDF